jgi:hypothetical protein
MGERLKAWGKQDIKCLRCKNPAVKTYEILEDYEMSNSYMIRYFERLCSVCLYWSAWVLINNGKIKAEIL